MLRSCFFVVFVAIGNVQVMFSLFVIALCDYMIISSLILSPTSNLLKYEFKIFLMVLVKTGVII